MIKIKIGIRIEEVFLTIVFVSFLFFGYGQISGNFIKHDTLIGYFAADAIQDEGWAEGIKINGHYKYFPTFASAGFNDTIAWYAPILMQDSVLLSYTGGIETYDSMILIVYLLTLMSLLMMYSIISNYNKCIAMLSVPLMFFILSEKFYNCLILGQWAYVTVNLFILGVFWTFTKLDLKNVFWILAIFLIGIIFSHPSEMIYMLIFICLFLLISFIKKHFKLEYAKTILIGGIVALLFSIYFIMILKLSALSVFAYDQGGFITLKPINGDIYGYPPVYIKYFGLYGIMIAIGILFSIYILYKNKETVVPLLIGLFMIFVGYSNYLGGGLGSRAFQNRFFWPIYLSVLFGVGLYSLSKIFLKKIGMVHCIVLSTLLLASVIAVYHQDIQSTSLVNREQMMMFNWIKENTPTDSQIYFFYGDPYSQTSILWLSRRVSLLVQPEDFIDSLSKSIIKQEYLTRHVSGFLYHRTGFLSSKNYYEEKGAEYFLGLRNICNYSYYVFNKKSIQPVLAQYNIAIMKQMLLNDWIKEVYSNELVSVLKNNKAGEECINNKKNGTRTEE